MKAKTLIRKEWDTETKTKLWGMVPWIWNMAVSNHCQTALAIQRASVYLELEEASAYHKLEEVYGFLGGGSDPMSRTEFSS